MHVELLLTNRPPGIAPVKLGVALAEEPEENFVTKLAPSPMPGELSNLHRSPHRSPHRSLGIPRNFLGIFGIFRVYGPIWAVMGPYKPMWALMGPYGPGPGL